VRDTGPGIPANRLGELFQPFNRIGAERSSIEGTGIGLVITKNLVEAMEGSIDVTSTVGEGTAFRVEFQLAVAATQTD
jgi:signal transduction histidine kinase